MKVDLGKSGILDLKQDTVDLIATATGKTDRRHLCAMVRASFRHIAGVLAQAEPDPLLDDVDAALAAHLIGDPVPGVEPDRLRLLLTAWEDAEESLSLCARIAVRACARLVEEVMRAPDKAAFDAVVPPLVADMDDEAAGLCSAYIGAIADTQGWRSERPRRHYLQRRLARIRSTFVQSAEQERGAAWVKRRLDGARGAVAPVVG